MTDALDFYTVLGVRMYIKPPKKPRVRIRAKRSADKHNGWSADEDKLLKELYPTKNNDFICELLGRSKSAVRNRASLLNLKKIVLRKVRNGIYQ